MNQDLAKYQAAEGNYRATAISVRDQKEVGVLNFIVETKTKASATGDSKHYLEARVIFDGSYHADMNFKEIDFDERTGDFEAIYSQPTRGVELQLKGNFNNGTFAGTVGSPEYPEFALRFSGAIIQAPADQLSSGTSPARRYKEGDSKSLESPLGTPAMKFASVEMDPQAKGPNDISKAKLVIRGSEIYADQRFRNDLTAVTKPQVTLSFASESGSDPRTYVFQDTHLDRKAGVLSAKRPQSMPGFDFVQQLDCLAVLFDDDSPGWSCTYSSTLREAGPPLHFVLRSEN